MASLSDKITLEGHDFKVGANVVQAYMVDRVPAIAVVGTKDAGIRFCGMPARPGSGEVANCSGPHLGIRYAGLSLFCPKAVTVGHKLALESGGIVSD